jgi:hypothetical protein
LPLDLLLEPPVSTGGLAVRSWINDALAVRDTIENGFKVFGNAKHRRKTFVVVLFYKRKDVQNITSAS